jgi:adenosylcobinamide-phosphate synthase
MTIEAFTPVVVLIAAVLIDRIAGEPPRRWHPLVGFGLLASNLERVLRRLATGQASRSRSLGVAAVIALVIPASLLAYGLSSVAMVGAACDVLVLYLAIAPRSLEEHAVAVAEALRQEDLAKAREAVGCIVSRDTGAMSTGDIARAAVESVLENGNDAVFGAVFWFIVLGAPGAVMYRLANTLDAMWGYRSEQYLHFGWAAARLDDLLNLIPARLSALTYSLAGSTAAGLRCWRSQGQAWYSPNAGPVMAAGAGALQVRLGGRASYGGRTKERPVLGCGADPGVDDIERAVALISRGLTGWILALGALCAVRAVL